MQFTRLADGTWVPKSAHQPQQPTDRGQDMIDEQSPPAGIDGRLKALEAQIASMAAGRPINSREEMTEAGLTFEKKATRLPSPKNLPSANGNAIKPEQIAETQKKIVLSKDLSELLKGGFEMKETADGRIEFIPATGKAEAAPTRPEFEPDGAAVTYDRADLKPGDEVPDADYSEAVVSQGHFEMIAKEDAEARAAARRQGRPMARKSLKGVTNED